MTRDTIDIERVRGDLQAEQASLDGIVSSLTAEQWGLDSASEGWTVADQLAHLAYFDLAAANAIADPDSFIAQRDELMAAAGAADPADMDQLTLGPFRELTPDELLKRWRSNRQILSIAAAGLGEDDRIQWYGPSMGSKSFLTARMMEAWAHGQDITDAVGADREPTDRLIHVARLGYITRGWSYAVRSMEPPSTEVRVDLAAPSGGSWRFGPAHAPQSITGPAVDFCLVTTQRRHVDDTDLELAGDDAREWMLQAQAFAGAATLGPAPRSAEA